MKQKKKQTIEEIILKNSPDLQLLRRLLVRKKSTKFVPEEE